MTFCVQFTCEILGSRLTSVTVTSPSIMDDNWIFVSWFILQAEVNFLGELLHPNLVKLIGYCIEDDQRLLVYEFMPRGSLENHLFRSI